MKAFIFVASLLTIFSNQVYGAAMIKKFSNGVKSLTSKKTEESK
jgi:hypothetical protein